MRVSRLLLLAVASHFATGCVERKLFIRSDPPGATISLNREPAIPGATPVEVPFDHYGTFAVVAEREGYLPLRQNVEVDTPWYSYPVLDFITEVLWPFTIRDHRVIDLTLAPAPDPPDYEVEGDIERAREEARRKHEELRRRAEEMRREVNEGDPATDGGR